MVSINWRKAIKDAQAMNRQNLKPNTRPQICGLSGSRERKLERRAAQAAAFTDELARQRDEIMGRRKQAK